MARIPKAQYETMPSYAKQMRSAGQELNQALIEAYTNIANMHSVWYGKRYNSLLQQFNNMIPQMSELLEFVVAQLPFALETIANNYSSADGVGKITSAARTEPKKINAITPSTEEGLKFMSDEVANVQKKVSANFTNAKEKMDQIQAIYSKVEWVSDAATQFRARFLQLKKNITTFFDEFNASFTKSMQQTLQDIQATENANTVN